jgi:hypothetical protein
VTTQFENQGRHRFHNLSKTITHFHNGTLNAVRGNNRLDFIMCLKIIPTLFWNMTLF